MSNQNRSGAISFLRVFATVAVVISHAWSTLAENPDMFVLTATEKITFEIGYNLLKWAVPVFYMITGALMLRKDRDITIGECICKYAKRMLLALLIFGIPYAMMISFFATRTITLSMIPQALIRVINGESFSHLWYLYTMIGIYLALPFIKLFVSHASRQIFQYTLVVMFIFNFCFKLINGLAGLDIAFEYLLNGSSLFYMLLGYYVCYENPKWANSHWISLGMIMFSSAVIVLASGENGALEFVMSYDSPVAVLMATGFFALGIKSKRKETDTLWKLDRMCFGVYLVHPLFIHFVYKFLKLTPIGTPMFFVLSIVYALTFVLIGFAAAWLLSLIKPLKKYVL